MRWLPLRGSVLCIAGIFLAVFIAYSNTLGNFFLDDDYGNLIIPFFTRHSIAGFIFSWAVCARPYTAGYFIWACVAKAFGADPLFHHGAMLLLHGAVASLSFLYVRRLCGSASLGAAAGLLYAVGFVSSEAVARIMQMHYLVCSVFSFLCLLLMLYDTRAARKAMVAAFLIALCSKEIALTVPLLLVLQAGLFGGRGAVKKNAGIYALLCSFVLAYLTVKLTYPLQFGSPGYMVGGKPPYAAFFSAHGVVQGVWAYARALVSAPVYYCIFSVNRFVFGKYVPALKVALLMAALLPAALYGLMHTRRFFSDRVLLFGASWIVLGALPFVVLLDAIDYNRGGLINTRYLYFASFGLCLIMVRSLQQLYSHGERIAKAMVICGFTATALLHMAVLYGNNSAYQYASSIAREIPRQTKARFPLKNGRDTAFYFLDPQGGLQYAQGVHLFKNGGLDGAFFLTYGFMPKVYVVNRKEYDECMANYGAVGGGLIASVDAQRALADGYLLRWDPAARRVVNAAEG